MIGANEAHIADDEDCFDQCLVQVSSAADAGPDGPPSQDGRNHQFKGKPFLKLSG